VTPVNTPADFAKDVHFIDRGFFAEIDHPAIGRHKYLNPPYRFSELPGRIHRPAPLLGQHNEEIYCQELGYSNEDLIEFKSQGLFNKSTAKLSRWTQ
jgi:crotonobetainyl-CoA:carnitine CoA-transferase CaiB-like acyl-CoA transferase